MSLDKDRILEAMTGRYVDLYRQFTELRPDGGQFRGPCPRHGGDGPNFIVDPDTGYWYCHSQCGEGGDVFQFVQKMHGLNFPEAVAWLTDWMGLSDTAPAVRKPSLLKPTLAKPTPAPVFLDPALAAQAHAALMKSPKWQAWLLKHRGWTEQTLIAFQIGIHQDGKDKAAGVWRVTFPVYDDEGRLTNIRRHLFGYKDELTDERRKELNKSLPYQSGLHKDLFPLSVLNGAESVVLLGGEPDTVLANQTGFAAVTGTSGEGTWKSEWAEALLGKCVTLLYDNDDAGRKGARKTAEALHSAGVCVSVASYPDGVKDFTEWVVEQGATAEDVRRVIAEAVPFVPTIPIECTPAPGSVGNVGTIRTISEWETPVSLGVSALPPFPVEALPEPVRGYVCEVAAAAQTPEDMPALMALAVMGAAGARRCMVQVGETHTEPLNLWCAVVMGAGSRKSAMMDMAAPLREYEAGLVRLHTPEAAAAQSRRTVEEKRLAHLQDKAAKESADTERNVLAREAEELASLLTQVPAVPRLLADDVTPEKVAGLMAENAGTLALLSAEGGIFGILAGRYSGKGDANLDVFLKGHAGDEIRVDRQGRPSEFIQRPALTVGLLVQPDVLASLNDTPAFRGRGFLGRFLYSLPPSLAGTRFNRNNKGRKIDEDAKRSYSRAIERILDLPDAGTKENPTLRHSLMLTGEAWDTWAEYADAIEARQAEGEDLCGVRDWASKLAGAVARIAGGFHLVEHAGGDWRKPISAETVLAAWAVGEYLIPHALAAFGQMRADPRLALARRALRWIERVRLSTFTLRDCHRALTGGEPLTAEEVQGAMSLLADRGYVRADGGREREPGMAGRRGSPSYVVNPCLHNAAEVTGR